MNPMYTKESLEKLHIKALADIYMEVIDSKNNSKKLFDICIGNSLDDLSEDDRKLVDHEVDVLMLEAYNKSEEAVIELFTKEELITMVIFYGNNQHLSKRLPALQLRVQNLLSRAIENFGKRIENILG